MKKLIDEKQIKTKSFSNNNLKSLGNTLKKYQREKNGKLNITVKYSDGMTENGDNLYPLCNNNFKNKDIKKIVYELITENGRIYVELNLKSCKKSYYLVEDSDEKEFNNNRKVIEDFLQIVKSNSFISNTTINYPVLISCSLTFGIILFVLNYILVRMNTINSFTIATILSVVFTCELHRDYPNVTLNKCNKDPIKCFVVAFLQILFGEIISMGIDIYLGG